jgi:hypothetical protein
VGQAVNKYSMKCIHTKDQDRRSKENGMGRACSMNRTEFCLEKVKEDHSEELHIYGMIILKWVLNREQLSWLRLGHGGFCGCGSEHSASMKGGEFL